MASPITSPLVPILNAIKGQLVSKLPMDENRILLILEGQPTPKFQGDQDILIAPGPVQPEPNMDSAAGRAIPLVYRVVSITLRTRFGVDLSDRADSWISDGTNGYFVFEEGILAALNNLQPETARGDVLLQEPMHWIPSSKPVKAPRDRTWGEAVMSFSILYQLDMSRVI